MQTLHRHLSRDPRSPPISSKYRLLEPRALLVSALIFSNLIADENSVRAVRADLTPKQMRIISCTQSDTSPFPGAQETKANG